MDNFETLLKTSLAEIERVSYKPTAKSTLGSSPKWEAESTRTSTADERDR
jgi:hypothetical protein